MGQAAIGRMDRSRGRPQTVRSEFRSWAFWKRTLTKRKVRVRGSRLGICKEVYQEGRALSLSRTWKVCLALSARRRQGQF